MTKESSLPIVDVSPLLGEVAEMQVGERHEAQVRDTARRLDRACREHGFFYVVGHGVDDGLQERLEEQSRLFFELDLEEKMSIRMARGGTAWRGFFPVGEELTSGKPDIKEGLYFGAELPSDDARVLAGRPLHGANLFPPSMPEFARTVLEYLEAMTTLGHGLMSGLALGLGLDRDHFAERFMRDPLVLFRIFHYPSFPATEEDGEPSWGVGEHTDYGVLTILKQDQVGGLEVRTPAGWIEAPPVPGSFVCNIGDMLERMTAGLYRSTPHRVRNASGRSRYSYPFFFDPDWEARIEPVVGSPVASQGSVAPRRWDGADIHAYEGTYGDYVLAKVAKVFPDLARVAEDR